MHRYDIFIGQMYKDVAMEINDLARSQGYSVLPMRYDDVNIDIDDRRLLVWLDDDSVIEEFEVG
jgi:hypothetical protein